ncbi:hypothetical protein P7K49_030119 [Saguinus oedipus]|uniref:Uncharacterized protein n=1 Tax=Saguinus oedipus TaxID=9490 RepID=A0ABQ9U286_SAGOE|nr:hypothetical protein P7K49_030119 [Saguinus oedipus]
MLLSATSVASVKNVNDPAITGRSEDDQLFLHQELPPHGVAGAATSLGPRRPAALWPQPGDPPQHLSRRGGRCGGGGRARPPLSPLWSHLFERRLFRRARAGGTDLSQKRKMPSVHTRPEQQRRPTHPETQTPELSPPLPPSPSQPPQPEFGPRPPPLLTLPPPARPESFILNLRTRNLAAPPISEPSNKNRKGCGQSFLFGGANSEPARGTRPTGHT